MKNLPGKNTESDLISIVMPTYNQSEFINEAIGSILSQSYRNWELIIVDDGSTDETSEILKKYEMQDERITVLWKENGGTGSALNLGFEHARGDYETWFASDCKMFPNCLELLLLSLKGNPEKFVYGNTEIINEDGKYLRPLKTMDFNREKLLGACYIGIANMWEKSLRLEAGNSYALTPSEDFDMYLRMSEKSDFVHIPIILAQWRDHKKNLTKTVTVPGGWKDHYRFIEEAKMRRVMPPFFSVMLVTYNRLSMLREALESIEKQTFKDYEVLIWSNSHDKKKDKRIVGSFNNPKFKWQESVNMPVYEVRNKLLDKAIGKYITLLDDDDLFPDDALKDRYDCIQSNNSPDFIYSDVERFNQENGEKVLHPASRITAEFILKNGGTKWKMVGACLTISSPVFKKMKYDAELFPNHTGDLDLAVRLLNANLRYNVLNKVTYIYRGHNGQGSKLVNGKKNEWKGLFEKIKRKHIRKIDKREEFWDKSVIDGYFDKHDIFNAEVHEKKIIDSLGIKKDSLILEIGPGAGRVTRYLTKLAYAGKYVHALDISEEAIKILQQNLPQVHALAIEEDKIPYKNSYFDFIVSAYTFQHNPKCNMEIMLKESIRVLKPGGKALIEFLGNRRGIKLEEKSPIKGFYSNSFEISDFIDWVEKLGIGWNEIIVEKCYSYGPGFLNYWLKFTK